LQDLGEQEISPDAGIFPVAAINSSEHPAGDEDEDSARMLPRDDVDQDENRPVDAID